MAEATTQITVTPKQLGKHLRSIRRRKGLSLSEVARGAGLSRRELGAYERGKLPIPESDLWVLAGSCGVGPMILLSPRGERLDQQRVRSLAAGPGVTLICGRFEGVDERVLEAQGVEEVSLGDFVLSGGEPAALALLDACVRMLAGVIGAAESLAEESFERGLLEYPHYTRPQEWQGRAVPEILLSGHHEKIHAWRQARAEETTRQRRPDLWQLYTTAKGRPS